MRRRTCAKIRYFFIFICIVYLFVWRQQERAWLSRCESLTSSAEESPKVYGPMIAHGKSKYTDEPPGCKLPQLRLRNRDVDPFFHPINLRECDEDRSWVWVRNGSFGIEAEAAQRHG